MFVYKHTETVELAYFLRKIQILRVNNSRTFTLKNAKSSGYYFCTNSNIWGGFEIWTSVPLTSAFAKQRK